MIEDKMILSIITVLLMICAFLEIYKVKFLSSDDQMAKIEEEMISAIMFTLMLVCFALGIILLLNVISGIDGHWYDFIISKKKALNRNASNRNFVAYYDPATKTVRYRVR